DPAAKTFAAAGNLVTARFGHTATMLGNGKILLAGGFSTTFGPSARSAELYDPAAGTFTATAGAMVQFTGRHTATLLDNGTVLIVGGSSGDIQARAEVYDPSTDHFTQVGATRTPRYIHAAARLSDGSVLIAGGYGEQPISSYVPPLATLERYVPELGVFFPV